MAVKDFQARRLHRKARVLWRGGNAEHAKRLALHAMDLLPTIHSTKLARVADRVAVLESLAQFASDLANHSEAERRCEEALGVLEQVAPGSSRDRWCIALLVHKGNSQRLAARYDESALTLGRALHLSEQTPDSLFLQAGPLNALGMLSKDRGLYAHAELLYTRALTLVASHGGKDHPDLAGIYHNLAGLAHVQGQFAQAEEPAREAIRLRQMATPPDPDGLAADLSVLGAVLSGQGRFDEAAAILSKALGLWRTRYGNEHYEVAVQLHNLAVIQQAKGDYSSAEAALGEALTIKRTVLTGDHPEVAALLNNLATVYSDTGRRREARECYDRAIELFGHSLGKDHPSTLACIQNRRHLGG